jgi:hypothetical protein
MVLLVYRVTYQLYRIDAKPLAALLREAEGGQRQSAESVMQRQSFMARQLQQQLEGAAEAAAIRETLLEQGVGHEWTLPPELVDLLLGGVHGHVSNLVVRAAGGTIASRRSTVAIDRADEHPNTTNSSTHPSTHPMGGIDAVAAELAEAEVLLVDFLLTSTASVLAFDDPLISTGTRRQLHLR